MSSTKAQADSQEIVTTDAPGLPAVMSDADMGSLNELERILLTGDRSLEIVDDPEERQREIAAQILAATSDEELEAFGDSIPWAEGFIDRRANVLNGKGGHPFLIQGFRYRPSDFKVGAPVFLVVQAVSLAQATINTKEIKSRKIEFGERVTLTTGAYNVIAQMANMAKRGTLRGAIRCLCETDKATNSTEGEFRPHWLVTPPNADGLRKLLEGTSDAAGNPLDEI